MLHALVAMMNATSGFQVQPNLPTLPDEQEEEALPVTSYLCQWKVPKKRKESKIPMSGAAFQKHECYTQKKRELAFTEDCDPRPVSLRGNAKSLLLGFLDAVRGQSLGVSLLFDPQYCHSPTGPVSTTAAAPNLFGLNSTISAFKESLRLPADKLREIEQTTREQRNLPMWFSVWRYRITASRFSQILHQRRETPPDSLVLSILEPRTFTSPATKWGVENEPKAIEAYVKHQHKQGNTKLTVGPCGFLVCEHYPFLGSTPDGTVYNSTNVQQPFGFLEVKCPYSHRDCTPVEACSFLDFAVKRSMILVMAQFLICGKNKYFAQVQGQMAIGERLWCNFVVFTNRDISIERINYDPNYWTNELQWTLTNPNRISPNPR